MKREFTDEAVRLLEIVPVEGMLDGYTFTRCRILGPAVLSLDTNTVIGDSGFGEAAPESVIWDNPPLRRAGAVHVTNCRFLQCGFLLVGFTGEPETLAAFRASFTR